MVASKTPGNISLDKFGIVQQYDNKRFGLGLNYVEIGYMIVEKNQTLAFYTGPDCSFSSILQKMTTQNQISLDWLAHTRFRFQNPNHVGWFGNLRNFAICGANMSTRIQISDFRFHVGF